MRARAIAGVGLAGNRGRNVFIWRWSVRLREIVKGELLNLEKPFEFQSLKSSDAQTGKKVEMTARARKRRYRLEMGS